MTMEEALIENLVLGNDHKESLKKINQNLIQYGLTPNQSKVYLYLTKTGEKTASTISKSLNIPRTESYHLLNSLEQKGIIFSIFGKPTKFNSVPIHEALTIIIDNEKNRIADLELKKEKILTLWETIPKHASSALLSRHWDFSALYDFLSLPCVIPKQEREDFVVPSMYCNVIGIFYSLRSDRLGSLQLALSLN